MVLLHIIRSMGLKDIPVYLLKEPWQPAKYDFHNRIISEWNLLCHTWHPNHSAFQQKDGEFELQNEYTFGGTTVTCPSGIVSPDERDESLPWVCSLEMVKRPKQANLVVNWDLVFIGHKGCDSDPILGGDVGTRVDAKYGNHATFAFPLKNWSHEDVWNYHEEHDVPWDTDRYEKVDGRYRERPDKRKNVDYVHACTNCIDRRNAPHSRCYCPKIRGIVENISDKIPWYDSRTSQLQYMKG